MCVRTRISDGRAVSARALTIAELDRREIVAVVDRSRCASRRPRSVVRRSSENVMSVPAASVTAIVVVQTDQLAELQMAGERGGFRRDAFHQVAVADDRVGEVIDDHRSRCRL